MTYHIFMIDIDAIVHWWNACPNLESGIAPMVFDPLSLKLV